MGKRCLKRADGEAQENILSAFGDGSVGIGGEDGEKFHADFRRERNSAGADGEFAFRARMAGADFVANFGANDCLPQRFSGCFESA